MYKCTVPSMGWSTCTYRIELLPNISMRLPEDNLVRKDFPCRNHGILSLRKSRSPEYTMYPSFQTFHTNIANLLCSQRLKLDSVYNSTERTWREYYPKTLCNAFDRFQLWWTFIQTTNQNVRLHAWRNVQFWLFGNPERRIRAQDFEGKCCLNSSVRGRVSHTRTSFWTQVIFKSAVSKVHLLVEINAN